MEGDEEKVEYLIALYDEADALRPLPTAIGIPIWGFFALFLYVLTVADLGLLTTFAVTLLVGSPGLVLVARDAVRARRRLGLVDGMIEELESQGVRRDEDSRRPSLLNATEDTHPSR